MISPDRPLPEGMRDLLFADARVFRDMQEGLRKTLSTWGYEDLILPTFEYADTLSTGVGSSVDSRLYRFLDRQGRTLALRPDLTVPTARVVGSRFNDRPMPIRIANAGSVFRYEPAGAGWQHEVEQVGVELVGASGHDADAEVIALAAEALRTVGISDFRIMIGHSGFMGSLLGDPRLPKSEVIPLRTAVQRKSEAELEALLTRVPGIDPEIRAAVNDLTRLIGDRSVLDEAFDLCANEGMLTSVRYLQEVASLVSAYGVQAYVGYDLGEMLDLDYYTGITIEGFAPGVGTAILSGGRYDNLIHHFGPSLPAVGWAITLDRVLSARERQGAVKGRRLPDLLIAASGHASCLQWIREARRRGLVIVLDTSADTPDKLWANALDRGVRRAAVWQPDDTIVVRDDTGERLISAEEWQEVELWRRS